MVKSMRNELSRLRAGSALALTALLAVLLLGSLPAPAGAADSLRLTGAIVHTVSGDTLSPGQVLLRDGKIAAVGETVPADGAETIDLAGQHLYPGMIALNTVLGLTEIRASGPRRTRRRWASIRRMLNRGLR